MTDLEVKLHDNSAMNKIMTKYHYLHKPIIRSKMLSYGIWYQKHLIGGLIWANPQMTKKRNLFGYPNTYDKWEVLVLARFYKLDGYSFLVPSKILSECLGSSVTYRRNKLPIGWKLQTDWVTKHYPRYPANPFVPRVLLSWSDLALPAYDRCSICNKKHNGSHSGTIYRAAGWIPFDQTTNTQFRTHSAGYQTHKGLKQSWVYYLDENPYAYARGLAEYYANEDRS